MDNCIHICRILTKQFFFIEISVCFIFISCSMETAKGLCAYCKNKEKCTRYRTLDDKVYALFSENQYYPRNALFCIICIARAARKIIRREKVNELLQGQSSGSERTFESISEIRDRLRSHRRDARAGK